MGIPENGKRQTYWKVHFPRGVFQLLCNATAAVSESFSKVLEIYRSVFRHFFSARKAFIILEKPQATKNW